jgi:uncharacterized SAM-binding protein YcdF (DUF218 family)
MKGFFKKLAFLVLLGTLCWSAGFAWYLMQMPTGPSEDPQTTDAIVVLTGGSGRLEYGLQLLKAGKARKLFVSGVRKGVTHDALLRKMVDDPAAREGMIVDAGIMFGYDAEDTIGNAQETAEWMHREQYHSLRLVTSSYHMPRSMGEFRYAMPDLTIIPDAFVPANLQEDWWNNAAALKTVLVEYHKYVASQLRHLALSATKG